MSNKAPEEPMKRYDPIHYSDMGGWSWDAGNIRECEDGEFVRYDDHEADRQKSLSRIAELEARLAQRPPTNRVERNN
jgi:hypothetical protein